MPNLKERSQDDIWNRFYRQAYPEKIRIKDAYDPIKDKDIIGRHLLEVFKQKARLAQ